jgi:hypothetical protein
MSRETLEFHHGKHHRAYVNKLNELIQGSQFENASLEEIVRQSSGALFNNAAQAWNHAFFWRCLSPGGGGKPTGDIAKIITSSFGSFTGFRDHFTSAAEGRFGSGWAWLVKKRRRLSGSGEHGQCGHAQAVRAATPAHVRCLGARLLHRLSQLALGLHQGLLEPGELGFRQPELGGSRPRIAGTTRKLRLLPGIARMEGDHPPSGIGLARTARACAGRDCHRSD